MQVFLLAIVGSYYGIDPVGIFGLVEATYATWLELALRGWVVVQHVLTDEELGGGIFVSSPLLVADCGFQGGIYWLEIDSCRDDLACFNGFGDGRWS